MRYGLHNPDSDHRPLFWTHRGWSPSPNWIVWTKGKRLWASRRVSQQTTAEGKVLPAKPVRYGLHSLDFDHGPPFWTHSSVNSQPLLDSLNPGQAPVSQKRGVIQQSTAGEKVLPLSCNIIIYRAQWALPVKPVRYGVHGLDFDHRPFFLDSQLSEVPALTG